MDTIKIEQLNRNALNLFKEVHSAFSTSSFAKIKDLSPRIPSSFVDVDKKVSILFAGQYSAGKSSILSILTGQQLEVGQGITTKQCQVLDWNGIEVIDTPGIHTQNRPDHDEITYKAMAEADLFVCTVEGFSQGLGTHFRKLLIDKGKGKEMMLVFNKMESSLFGNTKEGQEEFFKHDVLPVISPEYTAEDLYISYVDTYAYLDALEADGQDKEELFKMSGYADFYKNINRFIDDKKVLGKCTTSLYQLEQLLTDAMREFNVGDICVDGALNLLNQQRKALFEAKEHIQQEAYHIVRRNTYEVRNWGNEIANEITSTAKEEEINEHLRQKYEATDNVYGQSVEQLQQVIQSEIVSLQEFARQLSESEFAKILRSAIEKRVKDIKISHSNTDKIRKGADVAKSAGEWLSKLATADNAKSGWQAIFKLATYSKSDAHQMITKAGHLIGYKFKPWEAVKMASKLGKFGKILGIGGTLLGIGLQAWEDYQENKQEKQLSAYRNDIRNTFAEAANIIDMTFDEETNTWINQNLSPQIKDIDNQVRSIEDAELVKDKEFNVYRELLEQTKTLI